MQKCGKCLPLHVDPAGLLLLLLLLLLLGGTEPRMTVMAKTSSLSSEVMLSGEFQFHAERCTFQMHVSRYTRWCFHSLFSSAPGLRWLSSALGVCLIWTFSLMGAFATCVSSYFVDAEGLWTEPQVLGSQVSSLDDFHPQHQSLDAKV